LTKYWICEEMADTMHNEVKERVENKDIRGLQFVFANCLDVDPTFEKYEEDYAYCCKNAPEMFEAHVEGRTPLTNNQGSWNDDYWNEVKIDLLKNFSKKRFEHMRKVAQVVYAEKISRLISERRKLEEEAKRKQEEQNKNQVHKDNSSSNAVGQQVRTKSRRQEQEEELEKAKRKLAEENRRVEEERRKQANRNRNQMYYDGSKQGPASKETHQIRSGQDTGNKEIKKEMGTVLVLVAVVIIAIVLVCVIKN